MPSGARNTIYDHFYLQSCGNAIITRRTYLLICLKHARYLDTAPDKLYYFFSRRHRPSADVPQVLLAVLGVLSSEALPQYDSYNTISYISGADAQATILEEESSPNGGLGSYNYRWEP